MSTAALIGAGAALSALGVVSWGVFAPRARLFGRVRSRLPERAARASRVALTFDDGPRPGSTDRILDIFAAHGVHATFFVIGRQAEAHPELVRRISKEGHAIGNHTLDHHRWGLLRGGAYWREQVARTQDALGLLTGTRPTLFRAPMGFRAPPLARAVRQAGLETVAWSRRAFDGGLGSRETILRAGRRMRPGDILLLHDGRDPANRREGTVTADTLPELLAILREAGLVPARIETEG